MRKEIFSQREKERGKKKFFLSSFSPEKEGGEKEKREGENFFSYSFSSPLLLKRKRRDKGKSQE